LPLPDKPSIAVLPFQNMSGDPEQEYFADGIVDDIITALTRMRWLFIIARNSSFTGTTSQWLRDSETMRSVSSNDYDCDDNDCRDQRKSTIKPFRAGPYSGRFERRHGLRRRL